MGSKRNPVALKPCPFCGSGAAIWSGQESWESHWYVGCTNEMCNVKPCAQHDEKRIALSEWNWRSK